MPSERTYADRRPCVVVSSLEELAGPTHGMIVLPRTISWTGRREYDVDDAADATVLYERVLVEASDAFDLGRLIDGRTLQRLWPDLFLPTRVRTAWEARFPGLATAA